ncbi:hypothetical protein ScPMuIL_007261 [Solemya velum]
MAFLASIGKIFEDGGLHSILVCSDVYASATANQMLQGKQYACGICGIWMAHESLTHIFRPQLRILQPRTLYHGYPMRPNVAVVLSTCSWVRKVQRAAKMSYPVTKAPMHVPLFQEVASVLSAGLKENFSDVCVDVVECPDLTKAPFSLVAPGLCGSARLADIGGPPFLLPMVQRDKVFSSDEIARLVELPDAFIIGAGAGPCHIVGVNSELVNNVKISSTGEHIIAPYIIRINPKDGSCVQEQLSSPEFCLMGNFLCSEGKPGKVIEVRASKRRGPENFMTAMRKTLANHYDTKPVAMGGVFIMEKGKAKIHIMPDFSPIPLTCDAEVDKWLEFYEMNAPLVCLGELVSYDPGLDFRMDHFHCFSSHGEGGHYHYDTTPEDVVYRGYFVLAEDVYRIDRPPITHGMGR